MESGFEESVMVKTFDLSRVSASSGGAFSPTACQWYHAQRETAITTQAAGAVEDIKTAIVTLQPVVLVAKAHRRNCLRGRASDEGGGDGALAASVS